MVEVYWQLKTVERVSFVRPAKEYYWVKEGLHDKKRLYKIIERNVSRGVNKYRDPVETQLYFWMHDIAR